PAINVYPNPAKDNIYITLPENISQAVFALYDIQGKVLIRKEIGSQETLSVSNLAGGIYIYHVITDKQTHTGKIIIKN
ncbi:MAG: T9SS type A sorting domain-containing protein, partial [Bacteroidales bacterium]|nr:T9SS type A sorting domain-containing protein [Bacteroidales bacterium]